MTDVDAEIVKRQIQEHVAIVPEPILLMYLGAISAQLALRRDFDDPEHAIRDVLENGALHVDDWPDRRRDLDRFSKITRGRYAGVSIGFVKRGPLGLN